MKKKAIILVSLVLTAATCAAQKTSNKMRTTEVFDEQYYKSKVDYKENTSLSVYDFTDNDGTLYQVWFPNKDHCALIKKIRPRTFILETKSYHLNGRLFLETQCFFNSVVPVGITREYDTQGNLTKETDEDEKFAKLKVKPKDILNWMEQKGWINQKTGEGTLKGFNDYRFDFSFKPAVDNGIFKPHEPALWIIFQNGNRENRFIRTIYTINAETGEVSKIEKIQGGIV